MKNNILIVAAHPDDEVLGCGGVLARHAVAGDVVHCLFLADGVSSRGANSDVEERKKQAVAAARLLGLTSPIFLGFPDNRLDEVPLLEVIQAVEEVIFRIGPHVVYTHHGNDLNIDHRIAHKAVLTACRPQPDCPVSAIYCFEVLSSTEWASPVAGAGFRPVRFVDISSFLEQKMAALECYTNEMRTFPHARSRDALKALALLRGSMVGVKAAEAFSVVREVVS